MADLSSIRIENLNMFYGAYQALSDISMSVRSGTLTAVLGPSGSGKSTMLSILAGINFPSSGRILVDDRDVTFLPSAERNVGLVFQSYALFPHLSVYENVAFPLRVRRFPEAEIRPRVMEALEKVRITDFARRKPAQLSGGQQQRVAIARAIVFQPSVLLLDEPLAALDRKLREEVRLELRHLQRELGITTLLVTHDQDEAMSMADEVVIMSEGRIQQIAEPRQAYHEPANEFVAGFLGVANVFRGALRSASEGVFIELPGGERISAHHAGNGIGAAGSAVGILRPEQIAIVEPGTNGSVAATVRETVFLGEGVRVHLQSEGGFAFVVQTAQTKRDFPAGSRVGLAWNPEDLWLLAS